VAKRRDCERFAVLYAPPLRAGFQCLVIDPPFGFASFPRTRRPLPCKYTQSPEEAARLCLAQLPGREINRIAEGEGYGAAGGKGKEKRGSYGGGFITRSAIKSYGERVRDKFYGTLARTSRYSRLDRGRLGESARRYRRMTKPGILGHGITR